MKKVIALVTIFFLAGISFTSCKSHEKCPAYTKANTTVNKKSV
jgi:hypothetical protein